MATGYRPPLKADAMVHSLQKTQEVEILCKYGDNQYLARYGGVICTAISNLFSGLYYADDVFGVVREEQAKKNNGRTFMNQKYAWYADLRRILDVIGEQHAA